MVDSLFDKGTLKKYDNLAKKQAKLNKQKRDLAKKTLEKMDSETLINVFDITEEFGHPDEKKLSEKIRKKYKDGKTLDFDDLMNLDGLYKSNFERFSSKGEKNE